MMSDDGAAEDQLDQTRQQDNQEEEQGDEKDSFDPEPWKSNPSCGTRQNTPTKKRANGRSVFESACPTSLSELQRCSYEIISKTCHNFHFRTSYGGAFPIGSELALVH